MKQRICLAMPDWTKTMIDIRIPHPSDMAKMTFALTLAEKNIVHGGGPFAAVIYNRQTNRIVSAGVNLVEILHCSVAHAEMIAIMLAQATLSTYDLGAHCEHELFTTAEPCAMCMGAIPWSGIKRVVCAARDQDVRATGFDEGHKPEQWVAAYEQRGITVTRDVCRDEACRILNAYAAHGGTLYNSKR